MTQKIKVALLFGGRSAEHEISLISAAAIFNNLDPDRYDIRSIFINRKGGWKVVESPLRPTKELDSESFYSFLPWAQGADAPSLEADIYFPILHGPFGEDGTIQGLLEMAGVPYVGAAVLSSSVGMDKATSKKLFQANGLPVAEHFVLLEEDWKSNRTSILSMLKDRFALPFFVKPSNLGSSIGITKIHSFEETEEAVETAFLYDEKLLIEEGIQGREIECSVLGDTHPQASLPGEVIPHREFYDYRDKYIEGKTSFRIPADLSPAKTEDIQRLAIEAFRTIDCSGMARVDFFLQQGTEAVYLNEINTIPGFTEISMYPRLWEVSGIPFRILLDRLIGLGMQKFRRRKSKSRDYHP